MVELESVQLIAGAYLSLALTKIPPLLVISSFGAFTEILTLLELVAIADNHQHSMHWPEISS